MEKAKNFFPTSTVNLRRAKLYVCLVFRSFMQLKESGGTLKTFSFKFV